MRLRPLPDSNHDDDLPFFLLLTLEELDETSHSMTLVFKTPFPRRRLTTATAWRPPGSPRVRPA